MEKRIGYLPALLYVEPRIAMIKALSHFWNSKTSTFVFGRNELTPTIEEYDIVIGRVGSFGLVSPPIDIDPITLLSQFLGVDTIQIKSILRGNSNAFSFTFLERHFFSLPKEAGNQIPRVFLLAFFGFVVFPFTKKTMDPLVVYIVNQVCMFKRFSNMILGETFVSLNRFK